MATATRFDDLNQSVKAFAFEIREAALRLSVAPNPVITRVPKPEFAAVASICEKARLGVWSAFQIAHRFPAKWNRGLVHDFEAAIIEGARVTQWHYKRNVIERRADLDTLIASAESAASTRRRLPLSLNTCLHFVRREFARESTAPQDIRFGYDELRTLCLDMESLVNAAFSGREATAGIEHFVSKITANLNRLVKQIELRSPKFVIKAMAEELFEEVFDHMEAIGERLVKPQEKHEITTTWEDELFFASKSLVKFELPKSLGEFADLTVEENGLAQVTNDVVTSHLHQQICAREGTDMVEDKPQPIHRFDFRSHDELLQKELEMRREYSGLWVAYQIIESGKSRRRIDVIESAATEDELDQKLQVLGLGDLMEQHNSGIHVQFCSTRVKKSPFGFLNTPGRQ